MASRNRRELIAHEIAHATVGPHCISIWEDSKGVLQGECLPPGIPSVAENIDSIMGALTCDFVLVHGRPGKVREILAHANGNDDALHLQGFIRAWTGTQDDLAVIMARGLRRGHDIGMMFANMLNDNVLQFLLAVSSGHKSFIVDLANGVEPHFHQTREQFCDTNGLPCLPLSIYEFPHQALH